MLKKPVGKARGSKAPGLSAEAYAKAELYSGTPGRCDDPERR